MAGVACVWGCDNKVHAAVEEANTQTVVSGPACHRPSHDCCAKKKEQASVTEKSSQEKPSVLNVLADGAMRECPLAVNANAVTASKATDHSQHDARTISTEVPGLQKISELSDWARPPIRFLNRGPTYLRCRVFLI